MISIPTSVLRQLETRETANERWIAGFRMGVGLTLLCFHGMIMLWRPSGLVLHPASLAIDVLILSYGAALLLYLRRAAYRPLRKYVLLTLDLLLVTAGMVLMRVTSGNPAVSYVFLMPLMLLVAIAALRFSPGLVIYTGVLSFVIFATYLLAMEGFVPLMVGGLMIAVGFTLASSLTCRDLLRITVQALQHSRLSRFFSPEVAQEILGQEEAAALGGSTAEATVLFADIRGFTTLSEQMPPTAVVALLNEYFGEMVEAVFAHQGMLDKFIGDAIMAVFGAPVPSPNHAADALDAAREMLRRLDTLNQRRTARGEAPLQIGIGLHSGPVLLGRIGSERRMEYTAIGDTVNVASRLEGLTKDHGVVLMSQEMVDRLGPDAPVTMKAELQVKGRGQPVRIYALSSP